uniref:P-selectin glycoprotein ligand 1 n=1 Tax=Myodes glareolus TaxID=447135 RepID=UPI00202003F2|nr:P-selectin glycoprotein ligand 1 [Myodes glareolus]XP_048306092.1 P-selectin glycoprotein ligand 1 [Myodes glareolus]
MLPRFLLLLSLLGPSDSLQSWDIQEQGTKAASGPVPLRARRQAAGDEDWGEYDYSMEGTDPPEMLINVTSVVAANPESLTVMAMLEQRVSVGAGTPESTTAEVTATGPAGPDAGGLAVERSTESATQWRPTTVEMTIQLAATEAEPSQPAPTEAEPSRPAPTMETEPSWPAPTMEAETSRPAPTEAKPSRPAPTEAEPSRPVPTEAEPSRPVPMEAETSRPVPTEAETSRPAPTEAKPSQPAPTEAEPSRPAPTMEAETSQLPRSQDVKSLFTEATATGAPSTEPTATETMSTDSTIFLGSSVTHKDNDVATGHLKNGLFVTPRSSLATTTPGFSDLIPVKQCLLVILILASLATIFLVCTVVLAVRLSRKNHMYPVRNYSPTEMICISSLLPEGGEGAPVTANGDLPKVQDLKTEPSEDRDGDDLTLRSFLP